MHWPGSQHQINDVVCADCHTVHSATDPMLVKAAAAAGLLRLPQGTARTDQADLGASDSTSARWPARIATIRTARAGPKLLAKNTVTETCSDVPRGKARPVPLGAPAGQRRLHELPHAARLEHLAAAEVASAVPVRRMPRRSAQQPGAVRHGGSTDIQGGGAVARRQSELECGRTRVHELPRDDPWVELASRCVPASLIGLLGVAMKTARIDSLRQSRSRWPCGARWLLSACRRSPRMPRTMTANDDVKALI